MSPPSPWYLTPTTYACVPRDQAIFFDAPHGRYLALTASETASLTGHIVGWPTVERTVSPSVEPSLAATTLLRLANGRLITTDGTSGKPVEPPRHDPATRSLPTFSLQRDFLRQLKFLPLFVWSLLQTPPADNLLAIVERTRRRRRDLRAPLSLVSLTRLVTAHCYLRPLFYSAHDACLEDSLRLMEFLAAHRIDTTLVIGVRNRPFGAHAWLEISDYVLNDEASRVHQFTPLVII